MGWSFYEGFRVFKRFGRFFQEGFAYRGDFCHAILTPGVGLAAENSGGENVVGRFGVVAVALVSVGGAYVAGRWMVCLGFLRWFWG